MRTPSPAESRYTLTLYFALSTLIALLSGCSSTPVTVRQGNGATATLPAAGSGRGGYYEDDGPGAHPPANLAAVPDAVPKVEPYLPGTSRPYVVLGKTYVPITDNRPFKQRGIGSWYGKKFQGQKTASGERYDMYKMTAAHPTLPIPSYARVTNLRNGRQVIVRINDRGPFVGHRIIDLSYTAALKLGYLGSGSTQLEVERLLPSDIARMANQRSTPQSLPPPIAAKAPAAHAVVQGSGYYIQLGAFSAFVNAEAARTGLLQRLPAGLPTIRMEQADNVYRLLCGPFGNRDEASASAEKIQADGVDKPLVVQR